MRQLIFPVIALAGALVAVAPAIDLAAAPNNRPRDIAVSVSFRDALPDDTIRSDGNGIYADRSEGVVAYIATSQSGQLIFSSGTLGRTLQFVFCPPLTSCNAPWESVDERAGLLSNVHRDVVPQGGLMGIQPADGELPAWIKFDIPLDTDPAFYNVCFDSRKVVGPCGLAPGGTSTDARIRRVASDEWELSANSTDRGDLIRDSTSKKNRTFTVLDTYSMPFSLTVKCLNATECP